MTTPVFTSRPRGLRASFRRIVNLLATTFTLALPFTLPFTFTPSAYAEDSAKTTFDLPADAAGKSLKRFSEQAGREVLFDSKLTKGVQTHEVKGEMTPREALEVMLDGTGLAVVQDEKTNSFSVRRETPAELKNVNRAIASDSGRPERNGKTELDDNGDPVVKLDTFEVFERKTLNMDIQRTEDDVQPYVTFDREQIRTSGASTLTEFLASRLTALSIAPSPYGTAGDFTLIANEPTINLRGLGANQTLILVDGRRLAKPAAANPADYTGIPISAIERIDILPSTASGIYGADALGGVINIVLKRNYSGVDITIGYNNAFDTDAAQRQAELSGGFSFEQGRTHVMFSGSWTDGSSLRVQDREFRRHIIGLTLANVPSGASSIYGASNPILGATTNISSVAVAGIKPNLTLKSAFGGAALNSPVTFVPYGYSGPASDNGTGLINDAGRYNLDLAPLAASLGGLDTLYWRPRQTSVSASVRREMMSNLSIFVEGARFTSVTQTDVAAASSFTLQANSVANPFNQTIQVTTPLFGSKGTRYLQTEQSRVAGGIIAKLPHDWQIEGDYTFSTYSRQSHQDSITLSTGAASAVGNGTIDVFRDSNRFPADFSSFVSPVLSIDSFPIRNTTWDASIRASGAIGIEKILHNATLSTAVEFRGDSLGDSIARSFGSSRLTRARDQDVSSYYAELKWPLVRETDKLSFIRSLDVLVASRYDEFETNSVSGSVLLDANGNPTAPILSIHAKDHSYNPTVGIRIVPLKGLTIRGSYATGFAPPTLSQLTPTSSSSLILSSASPVFDPQRGNEPVIGTFPTTTGGSPNLGPETTKSWSVGVIIAPPQVPRLRLSVDWLKIEKANAIGSVPFFPDTQSGLAGLIQVAPLRVLRAAPSDSFSVGPISGFDLTLINLAEFHVESIDYALDYDFQTNAGTFTFGAKATENLAFSQRTTPIAPTTDTLDVDMPRWRGVVSLTWERGPWTVSWTVRPYRGTYLDTTHSSNAVVGFARFPSEIYNDVFVRREFGMPYLHFGKFEVSLAVANVFNRKPAASPFAPFYNTRGGGDPRLANYRLTIKKSF